jgi:2-polyprenyl-3-methyl-5-hydroxy-6-metoxy-1,4-benzoquinol methylase
MITSADKQEWQNCYLCQSTNIKVLYKQKGIYQCNKCKFVFYKQIPSNEELDAVYSNYSREEYITDISRNRITSEFRDLLISFNVKNVLDIACGECYFLDILHNIDPELNLYATEHESAKKGILDKGHQFIEGEFFPQTEIRFDLIIFTEAIEHINDVESFLENANKLLNPGGLIYLTTPNFSSLERLIMGQKWGMITPPEHLSYFTPKTLNQAMNNNQFTKVFSRTENISVFRVIQFFNNYIKPQSKNISGKDNSPQRISDRLQKASEDNLLIKTLKSSINIILRTMNLGSSLKALYQKD